MVSSSSLSFAILLFALGAKVAAQLPLPSPPRLPPSPEFGATPSSGNSIPNPHWSTLLGNGLFFYEAQRSGRLPETNRVSWRNDSCANDGQDVNLDLSGGYYDSRNFTKATLPLSFSVMQICWGAIDHGNGYDLSNQTAYLDDMLRWSLGWLIKAHPSPNTLFVQIGPSKKNDAYWGSDRGVPQNRPSYQINDAKPGTDAAALAAAAFASCSLLYSGRSFASYSSPASLQDASYASTLLQHAEQLYYFATNARGGQKTYQSSVSVVKKSRPSSGYGDDLAIAALWLGLAQNNSTLVSQARYYFDRFKLGKKLPDSVFNWDSLLPGIPILGAQIYQSYPHLGGDGWQPLAEAYLDRLVFGKGAGKLTKGGLLYYGNVSPMGSINPAINAAMLLRRYATIATSNGKADTYIQFSKNQTDYWLGKNPMSVPYVVGMNPNSPHNPHSAMASGGNDPKHINTSPPTEAYVLYGAAVGGPDKKDRYFDLRDDWMQTEVAIDYNAPLLTLAAMHVMSDTADPFYTSLQAGIYDSKKPKRNFCRGGDFDLSLCLRSLSTGGKVGLIISFVLFVFLCSFCKRRMMARGGSGPSSPARRRCLYGLIIMDCICSIPCV